MRIIFMGTPEFSVQVLQALHGAGHEVVAIYSQPPRKAGRGKQLRPSPVQKAAEELGLQVYTPLNFKSESDRAKFDSHKADVAVVVAYGLILPQDILDMPRLGCLNIHASLLPRWRGAAPIQRAIMAGDAKTGVCIMQMEAGLDTGPVIACQTARIFAEDTAKSLHDRLAAIGSKLIVQVLEDGKFNAKPQSETGVTYAHKIDKDEARIDWRKPAEFVDRQIRGLSPFPGAWCKMNGERVKILESGRSDGAGKPGEILDDRLEVGCGLGAVRLLRLQRAGKGAMAAEDFLRGQSPLRGVVLE